MDCFAASKVLLSGFTFESPRHVASALWSHRHSGADGEPEHEPHPRWRRQGNWPIHPAGNAGRRIRGGARRIALQHRGCSSDSSRSREGKYPSPWRRCRRWNPGTPSPRTRLPRVFQWHAARARCSGDAAGGVRPWARIRRGQQLFVPRGLALRPGDDRRDRGADARASHAERGGGHLVTGVPQDPRYTLEPPHPVSTAW